MAPAPTRETAAVGCHSAEDVAEVMEVSVMVVEGTMEEAEVIIEVSEGITDVCDIDWVLELLVVK